MLMNTTSSSILVAVDVESHAISFREPSGRNHSLRELKVKIVMENHSF